MRPCYFPAISRITTLRDDWMGETLRDDEREKIVLPAVIGRGPSGRRNTTSKEEILFNVGLAARSVPTYKLLHYIPYS